MRILEVVPVFADPFGGPVTVVRSISKELAKHHEVTVYTTTAFDFHHDSIPMEEEVNGYSIFYFRRVFKSLSYSGLFGQLNISYEMLQAIKENLRNFDVVHVHSWQQFPDVVVGYYAKKYGVPYILQVHGSLQPLITKQTLKKAFNLLFGYGLLNNASEVIALTKLEAAQYSTMGVPGSKINVIPNGFDLSEYHNLPAKGSFKKKYSIDEKEKIVLYLGRIHESKGLNMLAAAFSVVAKKLPRVRLVLVGPDDGYAKFFSDLVYRLGISDRVLLTGFVTQEDKLAALVDSEMLITPHFYGFPVTFLEACLARCPIITACKALDWIDNNVGFVVEGSADSIAAAAIRLFQDTETSKRFRENCLNVMKDFDISVVTRKFETAYEYAIERIGQ